MTLIKAGLKKFARLAHRDKKVNKVHSFSTSIFTIRRQFNVLFLLVLPRLMFERFSETEYSHVLSYEHARDDIAEIIVQVCRKYKFDGIVLEVYFQLAGRVQDKHLLKLVEHLGNDLIFQKICLIPFVSFAKQFFVLMFPFQ